MRKLICAVAVAGVLALTGVSAAVPQVDSRQWLTATHEEVIDGVRALFTLVGIQNQAGTENSEKSPRTTHRLAIQFRDDRTGKAFMDGQAVVTVAGPDKGSQTRAVLGTGGRFEAEYAFCDKGIYDIVSRFRLRDGKVRSTRFRITIR